eukprot:6209038-Pleurochrysis_carterae.AAC.7
MRCPLLVVPIYSSGYENTRPQQTIFLSSAAEATVGCLPLSTSVSNALASALCKGQQGVPALLACTLLICMTTVMLQCSAGNVTSRDHLTLYEQESCLLVLKLNVIVNEV